MRNPELFAAATRALDALAAFDRAIVFNAPELRIRDVEAKLAPESMELLTEGVLGEMTLAEIRPATDRFKAKWERAREYAGGEV